MLAHSPAENTAADVPLAPEAVARPRGPPWPCVYGPETRVWPRWPYYSGITRLVLRDRSAPPARPPRGRDRMLSIPFKPILVLQSILPRKGLGGACCLSRPHDAPLRGPPERASLAARRRRAAPLITHEAYAAQMRSTSTYKLADFHRSQLHCSKASHGIYSRTPRRSSSGLKQHTQYNKCQRTRFWPKFHHFLRFKTTTNNEHPAKAHRRKLAWKTYLKKCLPISCAK